MSALTRREACARLALGGAVLAAAPALPAKEPAFRLRYIVASSLYGTLPLAEILPEVAKHGSDTIDLWPKPHGSQREQVDEMGLDRAAELFASHKVKVGCLTRYDLGPARLAPEIDVGRRFGATLIVTGAGKATGTDLKASIRGLVEGLKPTVEAAAAAGITIAIENHSGHMLATPDSVRWFAEAATPTNLGIALAPYHLPQDAELLGALVRDLGPKLALFYAWQHGKGSDAKNPPPKEDEVLQLPGRGALDFAPMIAALRTIGYRGWTSVFMHPIPRGVPILPTAAASTAALNKAREYLDGLGQKG